VPLNVKLENQGAILGSGPELPVAAQPSSDTTTIQVAPTCPQCGSQRVWKDGIRYTDFGEIQRYLCRNCAYRFSHSEASEPSERLQKLHTMILKSKADKTILCRVSATQTKGAKNLVEVETRTQEKAAGATRLDPATIKGKIIEFAFWLQKQGYAEETWPKRVYNIERLVQMGVNLWDPEDVKTILAKQPWGGGYKRNIVYAYESFMKMEGLRWERPKYKRPESTPFIPTEAELDQLIAACGKKVGAFLQGLKDTGADPGELAAITWLDINKERKTLAINHPVKGHKPRVLRVSQEFINRVESLPKTFERVFGSNKRTIQVLFYAQRKRIAHKLANPRLKAIALTTFRDWKLTMEAHRTRDPFHVMSISGHKTMQSLMYYIELAKVIFGPGQDEFTVRIATDVGEAAKLTEVGFEYVTGEYQDGGKIFRKRK